MKERPILFSGPMVRAVLEGRKSQTRRVVRFPAWAAGHEDKLLPTGLALMEDGRPRRVMRCPYGVPGDRLWVRETWGVAEADRPGVPDGRKPMRGDRVRYRANISDDWQWRDGSLPWRPSIHMPRWASRLLLEITDVRVQRVQEISEEDAAAEGAPEACDICGLDMATEAEAHWVCEADDEPNPSRREGFSRLWDSINAKRGHGWSANPWVWAITFRVIPAGDGPGTSEEG